MLGFWSLNCDQRAFAAISEWVGQGHFLLPVSYLTHLGCASGPELHIHVAGMQVINNNLWSPELQRLLWPCAGMEMTLYVCGVSGHVPCEEN